MRRKTLNFLILIVAMLVLVNVFHHQVAKLWHVAIHIINAEDHSHHHADLLENKLNATYFELEEEHSHHILNQFISQFKNDFKTLNDSNSSQTFENKTKYNKQITFDITEHFYVIQHRYQLYLNKPTKIYIDWFGPPPIG